MGHWRKQEITFFVSSNCNLACTYCYMPKLGRKIAREDRVIDIDFAVAGMIDFFRWSEIPRIRFFSSGEGTTAFDTMVAIREQARKLAGNTLEVELQTNGFFSDEVADWVEKNINILWISVDGPPEIQDVQRPTVGGGRSSPVVLRNVQRFAAQDGMEFGVRMTLGPANFNRQIDLLHYFRDMGVRYVCGAPTYGSTTNPTVTTPILLDFAKGFVPAFFEAQSTGMFYQTHLMVNFDEAVNCYCRACSTPPCPQLTTDGYVSCCDWASFGPKYFPGAIQQCIYGRWDRTTRRIVYFEESQRRIENRNAELLGQGDCKGCGILAHCAGGCIGKVMVRSGDLYRMDPNWCEAVRYLAKHIPLNTGLYPIRHS